VRNPGSAVALLVSAVTIGSSACGDDNAPEDLAAALTEEFPEAEFRIEDESSDPVVIVVNGLSDNEEGVGVCDTAAEHLESVGRDDAVIEVVDDDDFAMATGSVGAGCEFVGGT